MVSGRRWAVYLLTYLLVLTYRPHTAHTLPTHCPSHNPIYPHTTPTILYTHTLPPHYPHNDPALTPHIGAGDCSSVAVRVAGVAAGGEAGPAASIRAVLAQGATSSLESSATYGRGRALRAHRAARGPRAHRHRALSNSTLSVRLEGPVRSTESFAMVNRHFLQAALALPPLSTAGSPIRVDTYDTASHLFRRRFDGMCSELPGAAALYLSPAGHRTILSSNRANVRSLARAAITFRNGWPPSFDLPMVGRLVLNFAWEFYHVPAVFAQAMISLRGEVHVAALSLPHHSLATT